MSESTNDPIGDVSRRTFVRTSSVGLGALAAAAPISMAWAGGDDRIKVGLIGCGGRGSGAAGQALNADDGVVLYAMGDAFSDRLENSRGHLTDRYGDRVDVPQERRFTGFDAYQKVLDSDVDVVILRSL